MTNKAHSLSSVASHHPIHGVQEFADVASMEAHVYTSDDVYKTVLVLSPLGWYFVTTVNAGVGTFKQITTDGSATVDFDTINSALATADADIDINGQQIVNAADPGSAQDVATKHYVDAADALLVPQTRTVTAGTGLTGGGDLSANRTISANVGTSSGTLAAGDDSRFPSSGEKSALAGTSGTPGSGNKYVTDGDSRNTNSRAPSGSAGGDLTGTYPNPTVTTDAITFAKMQNIATDRLIGRDTASTGDPEEITVSGGLEWTGTAGIQRSALTGDVTASAGSNSTSIPNDTVTFAKMQNITTDRLIGRDTASTGDPEELTVGGGLEFTGSTGIQRSALTGDVTASAGSNSTTIANLAVTTGKIADDAVTYAKIQNVTTDRLLGRDTAGSGDTEELTVSGGLEFTGSTGIQRSALTGDVTATAGSNSTTIANDAVTYAKMQNIATDSLIGRDTASTGDPETISVSGGLEFTGSGGIQRSALTGDVTASAGSNSCTVISGSTSTAGKLQLTDSTSSTSTTTAATPNSVKTAYDLANAALPKSGGTMTGAVRQTPSSFTYNTSVTLDVSTNNVFQLTSTMTGDMGLTLTNGQDGDQGFIHVIQDSTGGRKITSITVSGRTLKMHDSLTTLNTTAFKVTSAASTLSYVYGTVNTTTAVVWFNVMTGITVSYT